MDIIDKVNSAYVWAVKTKDTEYRDALKEIKNAFAPLIKEGSTNNAEYIQALNRLLKQHVESRDAFLKAERQDVVASEDKVIKLIESYIPGQLTEEGVAKLVIDTIEQNGLSLDQKNMGAIVKLAVSKAEGRTDGKMVSSIVKQLIASQKA